MPKKKKVAAQGWNDDGFDDWNFEDVKEEKKVSPKKPAFKSTDKWAPPGQALPTMEPVAKA